MARGFTMLPSYYEALRPLPDEERLAMYDAVMDYAFASKEPDGLSPILNSFFSLLRPNIDSSIKHYSTSVENGKKGGRPKKSGEQKPDENPAETQPEPGKNREKEKEMEMDKETETEKECGKAGKPPRKRFVPPTVEQVRDYCKERGNSVDPERFVDYYTANGWVQGGGKPIKDWQACVRTWERNGKEGSTDVRNTTGDSAKAWNLPGVVAL